MLVRQALVFLLALPALARPAAAQESTELPVLRVGETVKGEIADGDREIPTATLDDDYVQAPTVGKTFRIEVEGPGPHALEMRSYVFDAYLVLRDAGGRVLAEDDDGGLGVHARIVAELPPGTTHYLEACALRGGRGPFELSSAPGPPEELQGEALARAEREDTERRLAIVHERFRSEDPAAATSISIAGELLEALGDYDAALPYYERALVVREGALGPEHVLTALSLDRLAILQWRRGELDGARDLIERSLAIRESSLGSDHPDVARGLGILAHVLVAQGDYSEARHCNERALAIYDAYEPGGRDTAVALDNLAGVLRAQGELRAARRVYERALAIMEEVLGPEHPDTVVSLINLANLLADQGQYGASRLYSERALAVREARLGPQHPDIAESLESLARLFHAEGDFDSALVLYERVLAIHERALGPEHPQTASSLNNLAVLFEEQGDLEAARPLYERALEISEKVLGPEHPETSTILSNLAGLTDSLGDHHGAEALYRSALGICERVKGPEHPDAAMILAKLAELLERRTDYGGARALYERAISAFERVLGPEHANTAASQSYLAILLLNVGETAEAMELLRSASSDARRTLRLAGLSEGERYALIAADLWELEVQLNVDGALDSPSERVRTYERLLDWKGQVGRLLTKSRERLEAQRTPAQHELERELRIQQSRLSALAFARDPGSGEQHAERLRAAREERNRLEVALARSLVESGEAEPGVSFTELRNALPEAAALVDLFVYDSYRIARWENGELVEPGRWAEQRVSAWITRPGFEQPERIDLGPAAELEEAVRAFLEDLVARREGHASRGVGVSATPSEGHDRRLRSLLWDPVALHLEGVETVFLSPDGFLGTLPFQTIPLADGSVLLDRHDFVYLQDAGWLARRGEGSSAVLDSLLAVGGVDFGHRAELQDGTSGLVAAVSPVRGGFGESWSRLPASEDESAAVYELHADEFGATGERLLLQFAAPTEERLKSELPRYRVLHLATHGFFNPAGIPSLWDAARDAVEDRQRQYAVDEQRRLVGQLPGLLSGLVCAGANRLEEGREDGYLTADEVGWLDLSNVELVVLSACETGLGRAKEGEGLIGLRRAFRSAGAKTVVSSLWQVSDLATRLLMTEFYRGLWVEGLPRLEALSAAQEWLRSLSARDALRLARPGEEVRALQERGVGVVTGYVEAGAGDGPATLRPFEHAFFWGAFVLSGEWR